MDAHRSCGSGARYSVEPAQVPDFIALRGDPSDKLPGAPGVGANGAASLLRTYGSLEAALEAGRFRGARGESAAVPFDRDDEPQSAAAEPEESKRPTWGRAADLAKEWNLNQLATRLEQLADSP